MSWLATLESEVTNEVNDILEKAYSTGAGEEREALGARIAALLRRERERCAMRADSMGKQWGMLRSMEMTHHARAAGKIASAIRALPEET